MKNAKKGTWSMVPLGQLLVQSEETTEIQPDRRYRQVTVRLWGEGIVLRNEVSGARISARKRRVVRTGQFILSRIDARNGAFGLVPESLDGAVVSNDFPSFDVNRQRLEPRFLAWLSKAEDFVNLCRAASEGTTNRVRLKVSQFLKMAIPLPPLDEQRRIVARIEELAALIEEAQELRHQAIDDAYVLPDFAFEQLIEESTHKFNWQRGPLSHFAKVNPTCDRKTDLKHSDTVSFVPMRAVDDVTGTIAWPEERSYSEVAKGYKCFTNGDVIFARITPCMENGKSAIAKDLVNDVGFGSTEFIVIRPCPGILSDWLHAVVRLKGFRRDAAQHFKGTAGQQRVSPQYIADATITVPPIAEQHRIIDYLGALQLQVGELAALQASTQAELDALLPSVLDRAFRGEL